MTPGCALNSKYVLRCCKAAERGWKTYRDLQITVNVNNWFVPKFRSTHYRQKRGSEVLVLANYICIVRLCIFEIMAVANGIVVSSLSSSMMHGSSARNSVSNEDFSTRFIYVQHEGIFMY